ncbi:MAG: hypothetical protein K0B87_00665 [Candidatus Syntrophosphaera sp.]|nr:hypothetical protein [Candidatus Syntrophosphaera sp.]
MPKARSWFLILAIALTWTLISGQTLDWNWINSSSGGGSQVITSITTDSSGNTWAAVGCQGSSQFGTFSHTGSDYICVVKADAEGNWLWLQHSGNAEEIEVNSIAVDAAGNSYITGNFRGAVSFGSTNLSSAGNWDVFAAKLGPLGNWLWARRIGDVGIDYANGLALDGFANVIVTGSTSGYVYIAVWSSTGVPVGGVFFPDYGLSTGLTVAVDSAGKALVAGSFSGSVDFGGHLLTSAGGDDIFVIKLTPAGVVEWARRAGGEGNDQAISLAIDSTDAVYVTGAFRETADFGPLNLSSAGVSDIFVTKLGSAGAWLGAMRAGGTEGDVGLSIAVESPSAIYVSGAFVGTANFGSHELTSHGLADVFVSKLNSEGNWLWAMGAGSSGMDMCPALALDGSGGLRLGGWYSNEAQFGSLVLPDPNQSPDTDLTNAFLLKIGDLIPKEPDNLNISISGSNAILNWDPVTLTVYGQTVTPDEYIIYYTADDEILGPYTEVGRTSGTSFTHMFVAAAEPRVFYRVSAWKY